MSNRSVNMEKLKTKRKKNQYINELIKNYCPELMIDIREFKKRHKEEITSIFEQHGFNLTTEMYVTDCMITYYRYSDPICYKTELDNEALLNFDKKFDELFGIDVKNNKVFLQKIKRLNNARICSGH